LLQEYMYICVYLKYLTKQIMLDLENGVQSHVINTIISHKIQKVMY